MDSSIALFRTEQNGVAEAIPGVDVIGQPGTSAHRSVDGNQVNGVEVELIGEVASGWNVSASYALANAENSDGERTNTTHPRQQVKLFTTYELPGAWSGLTLGGGVVGKAIFGGTHLAPMDRLRLGKTLTPLLT